MEVFTLTYPNSMSIKTVHVSRPYQQRVNEVESYHWTVEFAIYL
jgi:hypothetical protein